MKTQELVGPVVFGIFIGVLGTSFWVGLSKSPKSDETPRYYLVDTKTEMKGGTISTTTLKMGGPYDDSTPCYDAIAIANKTIGNLASAFGGPDHFECKKLTAESANLISAGSFGK